MEHREQEKQREEQAKADAEALSNFLTTKGYKDRVPQKGPSNCSPDWEIASCDRQNTQVARSVMSFGCTAFSSREENTVYQYHSRHKESYGK
eukprot:4884937-Amphidinium_carterae.1